MASKLGQKKFLILIWIITIAILISVAYFFAKRTSEPRFLSKIDKIFFDEKNQPPKYVLTLPSSTETKKTVKRKKIIDIAKKDDGKVKITNPADIANSIPKLESLKPSTKLLDQYNFNTAEYKEQGGYVVKPWMIYSKNVKVPPKFFKIAVVIKKMGINEKATELITHSINDNTSLAFSPYTKNIEKTITKTRKLGYESYVNLMIYSDDFLTKDAGPKSINTLSNPTETFKALSETLNINAPISGIVISGNLSYSEKDKMKDVLGLINDKGLLLIDATDNENINDISITGLSRKRANIVIDGAMPIDVLENYFEDAEMIAREEGQVVVVIEPKPVNIIALTEWIETFSRPLSYEEIKNGAITNKPFALVPISALVTENE